MYLDLFHTIPAKLLRTFLCGVALLLPVTALADEASDSKSGWIEEELNPRTEWLEQAVIPVTRWMERNIQGKQQGVGSIADLPEQQNVPDELIPPLEAARLLLLLFPGEVLRVQLLDTTPPAYTIKLLSESGSISSFYLDARDGTLLEQLPPLRQSASKPSLLTPVPEISDENPNR